MSQPTPHHDGDASRGRRLAAYARQQAAQSGITSPEHRNVPTTPDSIPGYVLLHEVHRGAQGAVFEAVQSATKRRVAVKIMHDRDRAGPKHDARFEREIEVLAQLRHPNVVAVYDGGRTSSGRLYLVMDFIDGEPVDDFLAERDLPVRDTLQLFLKICRAVNTAHVRGVVHRDLKPSNIRVDARGEPHVLDFGLAKVLSDDNVAPPPTVTITGEFVGTLHWASPEQADGDQARIDIRTDVYALGVLLYHALTGDFPYIVVGSMREVCRRIIEDEPIRPRQLRKDLDDDVETIVLKCLSKDPERRYQSAGELAGDIDRYLRHQPIEAKRDSSFYVLSKVYQRHRLKFGLASVALLLVLIGSSVTFALYLRSVAAESKERTRRQQVQSLANTYIKDFDEQLRKGATSAREFYVRTALEYLNGLEADIEQDPDFFADVVAGYIKVGDAQGNPSYANLGDTKGAMESFQKARELAVRGLARFPGAPSLRRQLAMAFERIGDMTYYMDTGRTDAALTWFEQCVQLREDLLSENPRKNGYLSELASALNRTGNMQWELGHRRAALTNYLRSFEIQDGLLAQHAEDPKRGLAVARISRRLGISYQELRLITEAEIHFRRAENLLIQLLEEKPDDAELLQEFLRLLRSLCSLNIGQSDYPAAERSCTESLRVAERLVQSDPQDMRAWDDLWHENQGFGVFQSSTGDKEGALESARKGLVMAEDLAARWPDRRGAKGSVALSLARLGQMLEENGLPDEALEAWRRAQNIREAILAEDPQSASHRRLLISLCVAISRVERQRGDDAARPAMDRLASWRTALEASERAHQLLSEPVPADLAEVFSSNLTRVLEDMSLAEKQIQDLTTAIQSQSIKGPGGGAVETTAGD